MKTMAPKSVLPRAASIERSARIAPVVKLLGALVEGDLNKNTLIRRPG